MFAIFQDDVAVAFALALSITLLSQYLSMDES